MLASIIMYVCQVLLRLAMPERHVVLDFKIGLVLRTSEYKFQPERVQNMSTHSEKKNKIWKLQNLTIDRRNMQSNALISHKFLPCAGWRKDEGPEVCSLERRLSQMNISLWIHLSPLLSSGHPLLSCWLCGCVLRLQTCVFASTAAEAYPPCQLIIAPRYRLYQKVTLVQQKHPSAFLFFKGRNLIVEGWGGQLWKSNAFIHVKRQE